MTTPRSTQSRKNFNQARKKLFARLDAMKPCEQSILARCKTGRPFTQKQTIDLLNSLVEVGGIASALLQHWKNTSLSAPVFTQLERRAEQAANRRETLAEQLGARPSVPGEPYEH